MINSPIEQYEHLTGTFEGYYEFKEEVRKRIKEWAEAHPDEKVIKGVGWSAGKFGGMPTAKELGGGRFQTLHYNGPPHLILAKVLNLA